MGRVVVEMDDGVQGGWDVCGGEVCYRPGARHNAAKPDHRTSFPCTRVFLYTYLAVDMPHEPSLVVALGDILRVDA